MDFEPSLKPLLILLKVLGLPIPTEGEMNRNYLAYGRYCWILLLVGIFLLMANIGFYVFASTIIIDMMSSGKKTFASSSAGFDLSKSDDLITIGLVWFNTAVLSVSLHSNFFKIIWLTPAKWKSLWIHLFEIQHNMNLSNSFYRRIRITVWVIMLILFIDSARFLLFPLSMSEIWFWNTDKKTHPFYVVMLNLTNFITDLILSLFVILVFCAADLLALLRRRYQTLNNLHISTPSGEKNLGAFVDGLEIWRSHHALVCQFVDCINNCFDFIVLVRIANGFVSLIFYFYCFCDFWHHHNKPIWIDFLIMLLEEIFRIAIFIYAPSKLKSEVS